VLELTTTSEGLHRRLFLQSVRCSLDVAKEAREAAVAAVGGVDASLKSAVEGLLGHLEEVGYNRRLQELAERAEQIIPGITGKTGKWKSAVYDARNVYAHRPVDKSWMSDVDIDQNLMIAISLQWVLRVVLLAESGLKAEVLSKRFNENQSYELFLEQAREWTPKVYGE